MRNGLRAETSIFGADRACRSQTRPKTMAAAHGLEASAQQDMMHPMTQTKKQIDRDGTISQGQMALPLLETLRDAGGVASTQLLYKAVADRVQVPKDKREQRGQVGKSTINFFERDVRWAQQRAKLEGLVEKSGPNQWRITTKGRAALTKASPGVVVTIFTTAHGIALWGCASDAIRHIDDQSVNMLLTSPPYPLLTAKSYGNKAEREYVDWFLRMAEHWPRKLTHDGSVVINLGDAFRHGEPVMSLYQEKLLIRLEEELGLRLAQRFAWFNPSKLPAPAEWVTVRRVRVRPSLAGC